MTPRSSYEKYERKWSRLRSNNITNQWLIPRGFPEFFVSNQQERQRRIQMSRTGGGWKVGPGAFPRIFSNFWSVYCAVSKSISSLINIKCKHAFSFSFPSALTSHFLPFSLIPTLLRTNYVPSPPPLDSLIKNVESGRNLWRIWKFDL